MSAPSAQLIRSTLLAEHGIPHCFSTRVGGVSSGPFASLNLGNPSDLPADRRDPPANIRENFRRILSAMDCAGRTITEVHQVHGGAVHIVPNVPPGSPPVARSADPKADALISDDPRRVAVIRVADCAPILLATPDGKWVAAVHAGWRGVVAGVLPNTIGTLKALGASELIAAVGPCIGPDHFEVGPEVAAEFERVFGADSRGIVRPGAPGKSHVDLKAALKRQLEACRVRRVDVLDHCTYADARRFFSHRRERGLTGRTAGLIGPKT